MAGGRGRKEPWPALGARPVRTSPPPAEPATAPRWSGARHCWVVDAPGHPGRWPGLIAEWRRSGPVGCWEGRTVFGIEAGGRVVLVEAWLPAEHLEPA